MQFFAMQRSGHHAILVDYILTHLYDQIVYHWNECYVLGDLIVASRIVKYTYGERQDMTYRRTDHQYTDDGIICSHPIEPNAVLLLNFEDCPLQVSQQLPPSHRVLVIRDPYNQTASRIRNGKRSMRPWRWKQHAREYLGRTKILGPHINISFNRWHQKSNFNIMPDYGGRSAFEPAIMDGRASELDVLNRWQKRMHHGKFRRIVNDDELGGLAEEIFGWRVTKDLKIKCNESSLPVVFV